MRPIQDILGFLTTQPPSFNWYAQMKKPALSSSTKCYSTCKVDFVNVVGIYFFRSVISEVNPASEWDITCLSAIKTKTGPLSRRWESNSWPLHYQCYWSNCIIHHWEKVDTGLKEKLTQYLAYALPSELLRQRSIKNNYQSIKVAQLFQKL